MKRQSHFGRAQLAYFWELLRTSYWFVPTLMTACAIGLSLVSTRFDGKGGVRWSGWIWTGTPDGAREVLSTIAGSMITVAGVSFSVTIVALTLTSSQFGPRLLRTFVRDFGSQVVLGTFVSTFVFCLLALRAVRGVEGQELVPYLSVTIGVVFSLASLGVLIYFIHHLAHVIQAEHLIASVAHELKETIERMFPEKLGEPGSKPEEAPEKMPLEIQPARALIESDQSGYLQAIDHEDLLSMACAKDLVLQILPTPGRFVIKGRPLVRVCSPGDVSQDVADSIRGCFIFGRRRTPTQDPEYAVHNLVELAVRALSPGINDPFSAMTCLDWLGEALSDLARRKIPLHHRYDDQRRLRVIADGTDFPAMADAAFNQIRQYGRGSVSVLLRLLDTIATVSEDVCRPEDRLCLREHADKVARDARETLFNELDLHEVEQRHAATLQALEGG